MTIRHMKIFLEVYRCKSITRAAEQLHLAQPAVSRAIQEIEQFYGVRLFDRISRHLYITESGKRFYDYALHIISSFDEMEQKMKDSDQLGEIRLGTSITIGNFLLPRLVKEMKQCLPQVTIRARIQNSESVQHDVANNELDLGLIEGAVAYPELDSISFMEDRLAVIVPPEHELLKKEAVQLSDLLDYDLLLREKGSAVRGLFDYVLLSHELKAAPIWESASTQVLLAGVREGLGISVLPYRLAEQEIRSGAIAELCLPSTPFIRKFTAVYHKNKYLTPAMQELLELCKTRCRFAAP